MSLSSGIAALAARVAREFTDRFGMMISDPTGIVTVGDVMPDVVISRFSARRVGGIVTVSVEITGEIPTGVVNEALRFAPGWRPVGATAVAAIRAEPNTVRASASLTTAGNVYLYTEASTPTVLAPMTFVYSIA